MYRRAALGQLEVGDVILYTKLDATGVPRVTGEAFVSGVAEVEDGHLNVFGFLGDDEEQLFSESTPNLIVLRKVVEPRV